MIAVVFVIGIAIAMALMVCRAGFMLIIKGIIWLEFWLRRQKRP